MKWEFNTKRFLRTLLGYLVIILVLDMTLTHYFDIGEPQQSIIEIFGAVIIFQIVEALLRRYRHKA